jgi:hypothetical protein
MDHFACASHRHPTAIPRGIRLGKPAVSWY